MIPAIARILPWIIKLEPAFFSGAPVPAAVPSALLYLLLLRPVQVVLSMNLRFWEISRWNDTDPGLTLV